MCADKYYLAVGSVIIGGIFSSLPKLQACWDMSRKELPPKISVKLE